MFKFARCLVIFYHPFLEEYVVGWGCEMCNGVNRLAYSSCSDCGSLIPVEVTAFTLVVGTFELEQIGSASIN